ncbi:type IV secretory system conjugative DNA transfer family protein [Mycoplasmopsis arginini]|uniref:Type IV secretory system conjugative DNA transfer family protein n=1 Tax=Mycoplasmopsis arginini TaxID=2094 RepID=A0ABZ2AJJ2_MYCAR|nr:type IV secretory system conjugative DNA transfer family protein [Mycoplasmopsis arginini]WVN22274.1 type IV secretory system conjugative DNA transfer family protein [Mycoplasmopsis arginini]VEU81683.1 conjugal transfer coupling protein TraG [Mycoplasmopsis arginini]
MKKRTVLNDKTKIILSSIFSFVIWPAVAFFLIATLMLFIQTKSFKLVSEWIGQKRSYFNDVLNFWKINNTYRNLGILFIFIGSGLLMLIFNFHMVVNKLKNKIAKKRDEEFSQWLYNQITQEGNFNKFKKKFKLRIPNFILGNLALKKTRFNYYVNNSDAHAICLGISGSKKTEKVVIPNLHYNATLENDKKPNIIITDPKKQILSRTGNMFLENGYNITVFDFNDFQKSLCWNPLEKIWNTLHLKKLEDLTDIDYSLAFEQIYEIVNNLNFGNSANSSESTIWVDNGKNAVVAVLKFLLIYSLEDPKFELKYFTLANILPFLNLKEFKDGYWLKIIFWKQTKNIYWKKLFDEVYALSSTVKETLSGYLANAYKAVQVFSSNLNVNKITSNITFSIRKTIRDVSKPFVIFICFPDHKDIYNNLISLLITQIYQEAIDYANSLPSQKLKRMLQFYLEEFNSLYLPNIPDWMAISRSRNILFLLVIQDYEQLQKYTISGKSGKAIISQARLTYLLETNSMETLKAFSESLGQKIVERESTTKNKDNTSITISESKETLMSISDLKYKDADATIISSGGNKPILLNLKPAYEYLKYADYEHNTSYITIDNNETWDFSKMEPLSFSIHDEKTLYNRLEIADIKHTDININDEFLKAVSKLEDSREKLICSMNVNKEINNE